MQIEIRKKLAPFSHLPGTSALIPRTPWEVQVFPALLRFHHLGTGQREEIPLAHTGPIEGFTVQQDLERGFIRFFGRAKEGYFCSYLKANEQGIELDGKKLPFVSLEPDPLPPQKERLSFGVHKAQNWDFIKARLDPCEIWPFWLLLAQQTPKAALHKVGSFSLLASCERASKVEIVYLWRQVLLGCIQGILSPRLFDEQYQGLFPNHEADKGISPLGLLHEGARQIRALFFLEQEGEISLLPHFPPECHAGRFIFVQTARGDQLSFEWSKKRIKKVVFSPAYTGERFFKLQKGISSFRIRSSLKDKGRQASSEKPFFCSGGSSLFLDRFSE